MTVVVFVNISDQLLYQLFFLCIYCSIKEIDLYRCFIKCRPCPLTKRTAVWSTWANSHCTRRLCLQSHPRWMSSSQTIQESL